MSLESATTISGLQASNPAGSDSQLQGYQHLQLIKSVLKLQFPGVGGSGYAIPINAKETELNYLVGAKENIQTQLDFLQTEIAAVAGISPIPAGTAMVFAQAAAPTGWTQLITWPNHMLRVVAGAGGGSGGSMSPVLNNIVSAHSHVFTSGADSVPHTHSLTLDAVPGHTHTVPVSVSTVGVGNQGFQSIINASSALNTTSVSGGHTPTGTIGSESTIHTHSGITDNNTGALNWTPFYLDTIVCTKN